ncbi:hypothetical protein [Streptomyces sp. NPDC004065]|uniref:hypothetical protein n=1 Tax=Streptomyces sp. NPDC004065 TaxID=3364689 RepID=UPI00384AF075
MARGLIGRAKLFLDEPVTGFVPEARCDFRALVYALRDDRGMTIVLTAYGMAGAQQPAGRIGILSYGRLTACGSLCVLADADARPAAKSVGPGAGVVSGA